MSDVSPQLLMCAQVLDSYVSIARSNLAIAHDGPLTSLRPSGPERLLAAHSRKGPAGVEYGVLQSGGLRGGMSPVSLELEFRIHNNILAVEAISQFPPMGAQEAAFRADVLDRLESICIDGVALAEAFRHAAAVCEDQVLTIVLLGRMGQALKAPPGPEAEERMDQAIAQHKQRLADGLRALIPSLRFSPTARGRMAAVKPNPYPLWMNYREHPGCREINHVWHPKEFAEQVMAYLARMQGQAMSARSA